ncbi:unnamed protein product [Caenorhabditis nigoni]
MTNCLKSPDKTPITDATLQIASNYVINELSTHFDTKKDYGKEDESKVLQKIIDNSDQQLRMYGSGLELAENLRVFGNFPLSHKFFNTEICDPFTNRTAEVYENLKKQKYFCKPDLFVLLQNMINENVKAPIPKIVQFMMVAFLKSQEEANHGRLEFVKFDENVFEKIEKEIQEAMKNYIVTQSQIDKMRLEFSGYDLHENIQKFKSLLPKNWRELKNFEKWEIPLLIRHFYTNMLGDPELPKCFNLLYQNSKTMIDCLQKIIKNRTEMFLPYPKIQNVVRLFQYGKREFVIQAELCQAVLGRENRAEHKEHKLISTMDLEDVLSDPGVVQHVTFLRTPIIHSKHRAQPIVGVDPGEFYILAEDGLFHFLRKLIFVGKVFQREMNQEIKWMINQLENLFDCDFDTLEMVYLDKMDKLEAEFQKRISKFPPAKDVRNAKSDGFTVQNLKNELAHLGITTNFPEIQNHAEPVYSEVEQRKKEHFLRTCDLFDAIEQCQLACIFEKFQKLKAFLHDQRACARVWVLKCATCQPKPDPKKSEGSKKFKDTEWKFYRRDEIQPAGNFNPNDNDAIITCSDGLKLYSSLNLYFNSIQRYNALNGIPRMSEKKFDEISRNSKLFLLDSNDASFAVSNVFKLNEQVKKSSYSSDKPFLHNLASFSKVSKKHFYIRTVSVTPIQTESRRRVFAEEILEILEIILNGKEKEKLKKYQNSWKLNSGKLTLHLEELKKVFEDLDVDKSRISLIPDLSDVLATIQMMTRTGDPVISMNYEKAEIVMSNYQAIFKIFQSIICEIDWSTDSCKKHPKCSISHKSKILEHLKKYQSMKEGTFVRAGDVEKLVKELKAHCNYSSQKNGNVAPMVKLFDANFNEFVSMHFFLEELKKCGIPTNSGSEDVAPDSEKLKASVIPVWKARILFMLAWIEAFFGDGFKKWKEILRRAMMYRIPCSGFEKDEDLMNILLGTDKEKHEEIAQLSMITLNDNPPSHEFLKTAKTRSWTVSGHGYRWNDQISLGIVRKFLEGIQKREQTTPEPKKVNEQSTTVVQKDSESNLATTVIPKAKESAPDDTRDDSESMKCNEKSSTAPQKTSEIQKTFEDLKIIKEISKSASEDVRTSESQKKNPETSPPLQKVSEPTVTQKESKNCEKCFRTCEMLNETKKELKSNENKIKNLEKKMSAKEKKLEEFEDQKKKIEDKDKEIKKKSKEIEELKRKVEENLKIVEEKEQLISEVTQLFDSIVELKGENSKQKQKFLESQNQQMDQISHLEYELDMAKQTTQILNQKVLELENQRTEDENWLAEKQNLHLEIQENRIKIKEFYDENIRMRTENEVNQRMIQQLLDKLSSATLSGISYSNPPAASSDRDYSNPANYRRPESPSFGSNYSNLRPPVSTPDTSNSSNPRSTCSRSNYSNPGISTCEICRYELKSDDRIYKCFQCRCPSHSNCASNWLKTRQECPSCNGMFLN